jgi:molybdate-binding protein
MWLTIAGVSLQYVASNRCGPGYDSLLNTHHPVPEAVDNLSAEWGIGLSFSAHQNRGGRLKEPKKM